MLVSTCWNINPRLRVEPGDVGQPNTAQRASTPACTGNLAPCSHINRGEHVASTPAFAGNRQGYAIYNEAFVGLRFGYSSAIAMSLFVIVLAITFLQFQGEKKFVS